MFTTERHTRENEGIGFPLGYTGLAASSIKRSKRSGRAREKRSRAFDACRCRTAERRATPRRPIDSLRAGSRLSAPVVTYGSSGGPLCHQRGRLVE